MIRLAEAIGDPAEDEKIPEKVTDIIGWIGTDVMMAGPLTDPVEAEKLSEVMGTKTLSTTQPIDCILKKRAKQLSRIKENSPTRTGT